MALLLLCMHLSTLLAPHLVILYHLLILKIILKGLHPALVKHHLGVILGLVGCRGHTSGLVRHQGLGLQFTLHCKQAHTCCSPVPPLASDVHRPDVGSPFWLCFIHGNISRCNGCKGRIACGQDKKPLPPPDDLVIRHRENVLFLNPNTGVYQQSREARNVYYHPWRTCIAPHFKAFIPSQHINVDREILNKFVDCHHAHIEREFGLSFQ